MKTVFLLFDSLNRSALGAYGGHHLTPNFDRLASHSIVFDNHFAGSLPCMPARRDMHTGRLNFLHRSWGPLEPFDDSFPGQLKQADIYSHLISDHYHYFEDGGSTYHTRYSTWSFIRGQESDPWVAMVEPPLERFRKTYHPLQYEDKRDGHRLQGMINRSVIKNEKDFPVVQCVDEALAFLRQNGNAENWIMQMETFDPHEPFFVPEGYQTEDSGYRGPILNWPRYRNVEESKEEIAELKLNYAALVRFCDFQLGRILDFFDAEDLWSDTALIMTTDHGFLLSEHDWWAKNRMPFFNEVAHIPLMIYHPEMSIARGTHVGALTQTIDLMPTFLDLYGQPPSPEVQGKSLLPLLLGKVESVRNLALYGIFGGALNATDGRYTYFRYPKNMETKDLYEYTLMPMHNRSLFEIRELMPAELYRGFRFTKGAPLLRIPALKDAKRSPRQGGFADTKTMLFDLKNDPEQNNSFQDQELENYMCKKIILEMNAHEAPEELYRRFDLRKN